MTMTVLGQPLELAKEKECLSSLNNRHYEIFFLGEFLKR